MAHFAQIDPKNNTVINVIVVSNEECTDAEGNETEAQGILYLRSIFGDNTHWLKTSINNSIRTRYASIGYTYRVEEDAFVRPCPFPSWVYNPDTRDWKAPVAYPQDGKNADGKIIKRYDWNEESQSWFYVFDLSEKDILRQANIGSIDYQFLTRI